VPGCCVVSVRAVIFDCLHQQRLAGTDWLPIRGTPTLSTVSELTYGMALVSRKITWKLLIGFDGQLIKHVPARKTVWGFATVWVPVSRRTRKRLFIGIDWLLFKGAPVLSVISEIATPAVVALLWIWKKRFAGTH
jgi:hypothetical protein